MLLEEHFSVDDDDELEDEKGESDEHEAEDLTTSVGNYETLVDIFSALFGGSHVGVDGDSHADVTRDNGSKSTNNEGSGCVEGTELWLNSEEEEHGEGNNKS